MLYVGWHNGGKYKNSDDCGPDEIRSIAIYSIRTSSTPPVLCFIEIDQAQLICPPCFRVLCVRRFLAESLGGTPSVRRASRYYFRCY
jgi:hypothetical protein